MTPLLSMLAGARAFGLAAYKALFEPAGAFDALGTVVVPAGGVSTVEFTNIPKGYKHLELRYFGFTDGWLIMRFNGVSASGSYFGHEIRGDGSGITTQYLAGYATDFMWMGLTSGVANPSTAVISILDYGSNVKNKTVKSLFGNDGNGSGNVLITSNSWPSLDPVTSITLRNNYSSNFGQYSSFTLYGVR